MELQALIDYLNVSEHLVAFMLGMPRIMVILMIVPFMGASIVTGQLRLCVGMACYMILHPGIVSTLPAQDLSTPVYSVTLYTTLILKEALIGMIIGLVAGILFWAVQSAGFFIDNQRGASSASAADPLSAEETTPLGSFLFQGVVYVFFTGGAFMVFLRLVYSTYVFWPVTSFLPLELAFDISFPLFFTEQVCYLMLLTMLIAGPIVLSCLLADLSLGLMNRFASQLNVYVLAMPVKSAIAAFLMLLYFSMVMDQMVPLFHKIIENVNYLNNITSR